MSTGLRAVTRDLPSRTRRGWVRRLLLAVTLVQAAVGVLQARTGLPGVLVGTHMVLACLSVAAMTATVLAVVGRGPEKISVR